MRALLVSLAVAALAGCASSPERQSWPPESPRNPAAAGGDLVQAPTPGVLAAANASKLIGVPYRFGGASPERGFDCSGLVQYSYAEAGVSLPHNTEQLRVYSEHVSLDSLRPGDLIFFNLEEKKNSHVAIYAGDGTFVHAPSTGKDVRRDSLASPYWRKRISDSRRLIAM